MHMCSWAPQPELLPAACKGFCGLHVECAQQCMICMTALSECRACWLACWKRFTYAWLHTPMHLESEAFAPGLKQTSSILCTSLQQHLSLGADLVPVHCMMLAGTVPQTWAQPGAFPNLSVLVFMNVPLTGTLPPYWGSNGSFPVLGTLQLGSDSPSATPFSGTLPPEWGSTTHWQSLTVLHLANCSITGEKAEKKGLHSLASCKQEAKCCTRLPRYHR